MYMYFASLLDRNLKRENWFRSVPQNTNPSEGLVFYGTERNQNKKNHGKYFFISKYCA